MDAHATRTGGEMSEPDLERIALRAVQLYAVEEL